LYVHDQKPSIIKAGIGLKTRHLKPTKH